MITLGLSYSCYYSRKFEEFIDYACNRGFRKLELIPDLSPNLTEEFDERRINHLLELKDKYDIEFFVHNIFYDISLNSLVPKVKNYSISITREVIEFAKKIKASLFIIHPGYAFPSWRKNPEQEKSLQKSIKESLETLAQVALEERVPILIENGHYYISSKKGIKTPLHLGILPDELVKLATLPKFYNFGITLDIQKAYLTNQDILKYCKIVRPYLRHIHLRPFKNYKLYIYSLIEYLIATNYTECLVLECSKEEIKDLVEYFLENFPDKISK
jgi:sugar phosphate isomerase/epimerase